MKATRASNGQFGTRYRRMLATAAIVVPVAFGLESVAEAQEAPSSDSLEIVVTAQKRDESLADVPISITALNDKRLDLLNAQNIGDYARSVPSVDFQESGATGKRGEREVYIRGINAGGIAPDADTTGFYINDTPMRVIDPGVFDVERIEVLRGPQGTLWGASAMGGIIRVITKKADASEGATSGYANGTISHTQSGDFNYGVRGALNLPLVQDKLALRINVSQRWDAGYIDNVQVTTPAAAAVGVTPSVAVPKKNANDSKLFDTFAELRWTPSPNVDVAVNGLYHRGSLDQMSAYNEGVGRLLSNFEGDTSASERYYLIALPVSVDLGGVKAYSSTSYYHQNVVDREETTEGNFLFWDPTPQNSLRALFPGNDFVSVATNFRRINIFAQELRLSSDNTSRLQWLVGYFFQNKKYGIEQHEVGPDYANILAVPSIFGFAFPAGTSTLVHAFANISVREHAFFGSATYSLTDALKVTGGIRWFDIKRESGSRTEAGVFTGNTNRPNPDLKDQGTTWRASIDYNVAKSQMIYATASTGYRNGGSNFTLNPVCPVPQDYKSDSIKNYEVGTKGTWANGHVTSSIAAYQIDWSGIQQSVRGSPPCFNGYTANFGKAKIKGIELELTAAPSHGLYLGFSGSYTDSQFKTANPALNIQVGDPIPLVSKWHLSLFGEGQFDWSQQIKGFVRADLQYISSATMNFNPVNFFDVPNNNTKDAYTSLGASFGASFGSWELKLFGTNLLNEIPALGLRGFGTIDRRVVTLQPRTFGVSLTSKF